MFLPQPLLPPRHGGRPVRFAVMDGARGVAALAVLSYHIGG